MMVRNFLSIISILIVSSIALTSCETTADRVVRLEKSIGQAYKDI